MRLQLVILLASTLAFGQANNARMLSGVNYQTGTTYLFSPVDATRLTSLNNAAGGTATLTAGSASNGFGAGTEFLVVNSGTGTWIIQCTGCTINGAVSYTLVGSTSVDLFSDGTNYIGALGANTTPTFAASGVFNDTAVNPLLSSNINSLNLLTDYQAMQGSHGMTSPIIGAISIPNGATGIIDAGVAGFANTNSVGGVGHPNALAFYGQTRCLVNGSDCFGMNLAVKDIAGLTTNVILNGVELDLDPQNAPGIYIGLVGFNGVFQPLTAGQDYANWRMFDVSANTTSTIGVGYGTENAAADTAFQAGSLCSSGTCNSQPFLAVALNSSANVGVAWHADQFGNFVVVPHGLTGQLVAPILGLTNTTQQLIFNAGASPTTTFNIPTPAGNRQINMPDLGISNNPFFGLSLNATNGAYQSVRGTGGCTTAASIGGTCVTPMTVTWTTAFANANYSAGCSPSGAPTNLPSTPYISAKTASTITVNYFAISAAGASWASIDCWAIHD